MGHIYRRNAYRLSIIEGPAIDSRAKGGRGKIGARRLSTNLTRGMREPDRVYRREAYLLSASSGYAALL